MKMMMAGALALSIAAGSVATAQPNDNRAGRGPDSHSQDNRGRDHYGRDHYGQDNRGQDNYGQAASHRNWGKDYGGRHKWKRGQRIGYNDWSTATVVDYRQHHLRQPPRGYEWRESNGQYVLAAVATGLIASIILNAGR
jgi:Ni/Co efflux regulator RcnB